MGAMGIGRATFLPNPLRHQSQRPSVDFKIHCKNTTSYWLFNYGVTVAIDQPVAVVLEYLLV